MSWQHVDAPVLLATKQIHRFFRDFIFHFRAHCTDCQQVAQWKMVCESVIDVSSGENQVKGSQHIFHRIKHWATRCYAQKWKMKDVLTQKLQICAKRHVTHTRKTAKRYAENRLSACKRQYFTPCLTAVAVYENDIAWPQKIPQITMLFSLLPQIYGYTPSITKNKRISPTLPSPLKVC